MKAQLPDGLHHQVTGAGDGDLHVTQTLSLVPTGESEEQSLQLALVSGVLQSLVEQIFLIASI